MDSPSGALFEAAVAGKPVLCLYADHLRIAPMAKELFGKSLQPFHTSDEALAILKRFLDSDPEEYKVKFPLDRRSFYECFTAAFDAGTAAERRRV